MDSFVTNDDVVIQLSKVYDLEFKKIFKSPIDFSDKFKCDMFYRMLEDKLHDSSSVFDKMIILTSFFTGNIYGPFDVKPVRICIYKGSDGEQFLHFEDKALDYAKNIITNCLSKQDRFHFLSTFVKFCFSSFDKNHKHDLYDFLCLELNCFLDSDGSSSVGVCSFLYYCVSVFLDYKQNVEILFFNKVVSVLKSNSSSNSFSLEYIYKLEIKYYKHHNDVKKLNDAFISLGEFYESRFVLLVTVFSNGGSSDFSFYHFYTRALYMYEQGNDTEKVSALKVKFNNLLDHQKIKKYFGKYGFPLYAIVPKYKTLFSSSDLTEFSEFSDGDQIKKILALTKIINSDDLSEFILFMKQHDFLFGIFQESFLNSDVKTTFRAENEDQRRLIFLHLLIFSYCKYGWLNFYLKFIDLRFKRSFKNFITVSSNTIIDERKGIFYTGFKLFFDGFVDIALYSIIPQIEWWFRKILSVNNVNTSRVKNSTIDNVLSLSKLCNDDQNCKILSEYFGNDTFELLKILLLVEPFNLRNKIAHGLAFENCPTGAYLLLIIFSVLVSKNIFVLKC